MIESLIDIEKQIIDEVLDTCQAFKGSAGVRQYFENKQHKKPSKKVDVKHISLANEDDKQTQIYYLTRKELEELFQIFCEDFLKLKRRGDE